jgi:hypothetical protein
VISGQDEAFDQFLNKSSAKYDSTCETLKKERDALLTFDDVPVEHCRHPRATNPSERILATFTLLRRRTMGNGTRPVPLATMFKLAESASRHWRKLHAFNLIHSLLEGKVFTHGILQLIHAT